MTKFKKVGILILSWQHARMRRQLDKITNFMPALFSILSVYLLVTLNFINFFTIMKLYLSKINIKILKY